MILKPNEQKTVRLKVNKGVINSDGSVAGMQTGMSGER